MPILQRKTSISVLLKEIHINFFPNVNVLLSFGEQFALLRKCAYAFSSVRCLSLSIVWNFCCRFNVGTSRTSFFTASRHWSHI